MRQSARSRRPRERALPAALHVERAVLGAVLLDNQALNAAAQILSPDDFFSDANRLIYEAMAWLSDRSGAIDTVTLREELVRRDVLKRAGGAAYISSLIDGLPAAANVDQYARIIKDKSRARALIHGAGEIHRRAMAGEDVGDLLEDLRSLAASRPRSRLELTGIREVVAEVDNAPPRRFLAKPVLPAGDYAVLSGNAKSQKTFAITDLAVAVASGTPWLDFFKVESPGGVILFYGEGGKANVVRRLKASCTARDLELEELPIAVSTIAPILTNRADVQEIREAVEATRPKLLILDPFYLSAGSSDMRDLYAMGDVLGALQRACQPTGASVLAVWHNNQREGSGLHRLTGAGPAAWARVVFLSEVISDHTEAASRATSVLSRMSVVGGEIPSMTYRVQRRVWAEDPDDLESPLHVEVSVTEEAAAAGATDLPPASAKLLEALRSAAGPATAVELVDSIVRVHGHGLKRETCSRHLNALERQGLVVGESAGPGRSKLWRLSPTTCDNP